jgi:hypothetical protein
MKNSIILILLSLILFTNYLHATTWGSKSIECPICGESDTYKVINSYGSYIYDWPTKFQMIFWPKTDQMSHYTCEECGFSCFMSDFIKFDTLYKSNVKEMLDKEKPKLDFSDYTDYPILKRLDREEKCYKLMNKDSYFWCEFYRVKAYFNDIEKDTLNARRYRMKALGLAEQMLESEKNSAIAKELLFIIASMYYYTGNYKEAEDNIKASKILVYKGIDMNPENASALNGYLINLTEELMMMIDQKKR